MAIEIMNGALSKIGEYLVEATVHQVGYLFRFKGNVEGLKRDDESLRSAMARVQGEVERAKNNTEDIEEEAEKWLNDVRNVTVAVQKLNEDIEENKTCLSGLCPNLAWRYRLSKKAKTMMGRMLRLLDSGKFDRVSHRALLPGIEFFPSQNFMPFESVKSTFDLIIEAVKNDKINMVGIYGMGGVGKTTMAKEVAKKVKELGIFKEVVFATVSQNRNVRNIQGQMADSLGLILAEESEDGRARRLGMRLRNEKEILIILDDVWANLDLEIIGGPFGNGCKILLTTRRKQVCHSMGCESPIPVNALVEDEGLALFKRNADLGDDSPTINDLAKAVATECKGLPLAIVTIGSALKRKPIDEWNVALKKLKSSKFADVEDVDADIYAILKLSYDYLKDEETKLCFLLCSLYPEDYEIPLEELVRYGKGLGLYEDADTIEEARSQLRVMINHLKASCLLLDGRDEELVKMHDIVRDVAVWIASKEKKFFSRSGLGLKQWPKDEGLEQCTAISLIDNHLEELPVSLACPNMEILLLDFKSWYYRGEVSDQFFVEMKALKVVHLGFRVMTVKSLQFLTNLRSLCLHHCKLKDIYSIGTLRRLEILSFRGSQFEELAKELGELGKLRQLDLRDCRWLKRIPANVIRRLSQLEELYIGTDSFRDWDVEGISNASLCELNSLPRLTILSLCVEDKCIPKDFTFPKLIRYQITVATRYYRQYPSFALHSSKRGSLGFIEINNFRSTSFNAFKVVCHTLQTLDVVMCNSLTRLFTVSLARSLVHLEKLSVRECSSMKHIIVTEEEQLEDNNILVGDGIDILLPKLRELNLFELPNLMSFCEGNYYSTWPSLQDLRIGGLPSFTLIEASGKDSNFLKVNNIALLRHGLKKLKFLEIWNCSTQVVFQLEGFGFDGGEGERLLSFPSLETLQLWDLPELECIWKGSSHFLNLQNLSTLRVSSCDKLRRIFSTTLARHLPKLEFLDIKYCSALQQIIIQDDEEEEQHQQRACFSNLSGISVFNCDNLKSLFHGNIARNIPQLKGLYISDCEKLEQIFVEDDAVKKCKEIVLQGLERLELEGLPGLVHLCPVGCHLIFPSLTCLRVISCPKIAARFSVDQNGSVHVKSEARQLGDEITFDCSSTDEIRQVISDHAKNDRDGA